MAKLEAGTQETQQGAAPGPGIDSTEDDDNGLDEQEMYGDGDAPGPEGDGEAEGTEIEKPGEGSLYPPGASIPVEIEEMAREMKRSELLRMQHEAIEKDKRIQLGTMMEMKDIPPFEIDVDGFDYTFFRSSTMKVKSKKIKDKE